LEGGHHLQDLRPLHAKPPSSHAWGEAARQAPAAVAIAGRPLYQALIQNILVLEMLALFSFLFIIIIYFKARGSNFLPGTVDSYLTVAGILLAVLVFIFANYQSEIETRNRLTGINSYNCVLASSTIAEITQRPAIEITQRFNTGLYASSLGFAHDEEGTNGILPMAKQIAILNAINGQINIAEEAGVFTVMNQVGGNPFQFVLNANQQIKQDASLYYAQFCQYGI